MALARPSKFPQCDLRSLLTRCPLPCPLPPLGIRPCSARTETVLGGTPALPRHPQSTFKNAPHVDALMMSLWSMTQGRTPRLEGRVLPRLPHEDLHVIPRMAGAWRAFAEGTASSRMRGGSQKGCVPRLTPGWLAAGQTSVDPRQHFLKCRLLNRT